jgi:hypothetical protein
VLLDSPSQTLLDGQRNADRERYAGLILPRPISKVLKECFATLAVVHGFGSQPVQSPSWIPVPQVKLSGLKSLPLRRNRL